MTPTDVVSRSSRSGRGLLVFFFFIHIEMDAIFQPIKKSDTYQIKLYVNTNCSAYCLNYSIPDEELFSETAVGCTASYFVKII